MGLFGRQNKSVNTTLIFDIGSSSVGGAIVRYNGDALPEILFSVRKDIDFKENFEFEQFYNAMLKSLEEVTLDVLSSLSQSIEDIAESLSQSGKRIIGKRSSRRIKNVYCVFSSPWYIPKIIDLHKEFEKETPITKDVLWDFVKEAEISARSQFEDQNSIGILEEKILEYKLNGYRIDDPLLLKAKTTDLKFYLSIVFKYTLSAIKTPIRKVLSFRKIRTFSFLMAFYSLMRDVHPHKKSFITFDFRGEVTEIGVVKDDVLIHAFSIPRGKHTLLREISHKLNIELFEAASKLSLFLGGKLEGEAQKEIGFLIEEEVIIIKNLLKEHLIEEIYLPDQVYVLSERETETIAERAARSIYENTLVSPEVAILTDNYFQKYTIFSKNRYQDRFLTLEALYLRMGEVAQPE